jgi:hypothetical protein
MKLPEYSLKQPLQIPCKNSNDVVEFPIGTLIQPIWNEDYIPDHAKELLKEQRLYMFNQDSKLIMCIIGTTWYPVREENIRRYGW